MIKVAIHAIGDKANDIILDMCESVAVANGYRDRRFRVKLAILYYKPTPLSYLLARLLLLSVLNMYELLVTDRACPTFGTRISQPVRSTSYCSFSSG